MLISQQGGEMKNVMYDPLPRIYELSWQGQASSIELAINSDILQEVFTDPDPQSWPITQHTQRMHSLGDLTADPELGFGFSPCRLMRRGSRDGFALFQLHLPQIEQDGGPCPECKGKGKRNRRECFYCDDGRKRTYNHRLGKIATLTLRLILSRLALPELQKVKTDGNQLMMVELAAADREMHGFPLWGAFSPEMVKWIGSHRQQIDLPLVRKAMSEALVRMMPSMSDDNDFRAWLEPDGVFSFRVPGNCACMSPDASARERMRQNIGYDFGTHNVDVPGQQLSLLAGLAQLWEMARNDLYAKS